MKFLTIFALLFCAACAIASEQAGENQEAQLDLSAVDFGVSNEEVVDEGVDRVKRHGNFFTMQLHFKFLMQNQPRIHTKIY